MKLDPAFAAAYVGLAEAGVFVAEYEVTGDPRARFAAALQRANNSSRRRSRSIRRMAWPFCNGRTLRRLRTLRRPRRLPSRTRTEPERRATVMPAWLQWSTNAIATREALELLDRARKLDPLEPGYDVNKALFLYLERADFPGANALLVDVLKRHPRYRPALAWLSELHPVGAGRERHPLLRQALALDPSLE